LYGRLRLWVPRASAKIQVGCLHELATVPFLTVPGNLLIRNTPNYFFLFCRARLITVFCPGKGSLFDIGLVGFKGLFHFGAEIGIAFDKFRSEIAEKS